MKIAILGYGKMGKAIEELAESMGHQIALKIDSKNRASLTPEMLSSCDVAIEFSQPDNAISNIFLCFEANLPVVVGTTGWYDRFEEVIERAEQQDGSLLHATNFSVGVNIFFALNKALASIMNRHSQYTPSVKEIHHTQKLDSPSGTAITIAEGILEAYPEKQQWINSETEQSNELSIVSERIEKVPGTHEVNYHSSIDDITIKHTAHNRVGFAHGSIVAAEWLVGKTGIFTMNDVLKVKFS